MFVCCNVTVLGEVKRGVSLDAPLRFCGERTHKYTDYILFGISRVLEYNLEYVHLDVVNILCVLSSESAVTDAKASVEHVSLICSYKPRLPMIQSEERLCFQSFPFQGLPEKNRWLQVELDQAGDTFYFENFQNRKHELLTSFRFKFYDDSQNIVFGL